ncbi:cleavage and polyadenylation specificity factor subunit 2 [Holotrichia oblita]|uniref:Cleavage and polyadenylation specificity factor subunit 2 n=1 Tax=Holotrichia oblita TaxID=644536 RepID=A0ACB9TK78_HOLOL|nr:cleavage and polyadenylation specificity factor subunit 2 [Holotrichia oblita]
MTSIIKLQALSGAMDESPPCYILQVDEVRILLDCGWDEKFDFEIVREIKRHIHLIDAVLISYPDVSHLGALPYLVGKLGLNCPIYATIPVYKMGQMFMYDLYQSHYNMEDFDLFTLDDVDAAFDKIIQLKYNQSISMKGIIIDLSVRSFNLSFVLGKGYGLTITPLPAGHMIGGTIWKIMKVGEEDIIYANDFNHKKERHLNGCELEKLQRPSLLITDAFNANYQQARRRTRDEKLMTNILQTLRNNGNVLIAVDTAGRVLELAHMLDQLWRNKESGLLAYSLALLNNVSYNVVEFAKSQIEWMSDKLMKSFEGARNNPFQFKHLQLCHSLQELGKVPSPKVVLASSADMESGFSRELFLQWCSNSNNSIIITTRTSPGTLARDLVDNGGGRTIDLEVKRRVKLEGVELEEHEKKKEKNSRIIEDIDSDSDDDIEMSVISKGRHDIVIKQEGKIHGGFFKATKKQHPMFPFKEEKIKCDDYGEIIKLEDYKLADATPEIEDNKENIVIKKEEEPVCDVTEMPTKCIVLNRTVQVNAQVQYIDFEGRSDGESLLKILSQLRPRRVIAVRGTPESTATIDSHCKENVDARVFTPSRGETVDATSETHIYQCTYRFLSMYLNFCCAATFTPIKQEATKNQFIPEHDNYVFVKLLCQWNKLQFNMCPMVRLTDALVSQLDFQKGKDAELAWIDAQIVIRDSQVDAKPVLMSNEPMEVDEEETKILTLEPTISKNLPHDTVFINELKLSEFKQILAKSNITSEFSGGVLWCCNGTIAIRRVESGRVLIEGCISEDYYKVRELLYEQYAIL